MVLAQINIGFALARALIETFCMEIHVKSTNFHSKGDFGKKKIQSATSEEKYLWQSATVLWAAGCEFGGGGCQSNLDFFHVYRISQKGF